MLNFAIDMFALIQKMPREVLTAKLCLHNKQMGCWRQLLPWEAKYREPKMPR